MARFDIEHSCGHEVEHQIFGKLAERDRKAQWLSTRPCTDCWKEEQAKEREEASKVAEHAAAEQGLPTLTGSEKQCAWAESIRAETLQSLERWAMRMERREWPVPGNTYDGDSWAILADKQEMAGLDASTVHVMRTIGFVLNRIEAKWWIDHRYTTDIRALVTYLTDEKLAAEKQERLSTELEAKKAKEAKAQAEHQAKIAAVLDRCEEIFGERHPVNVGTWSEQKRVYIGEYGHNVAIYHHTGNRRHEPESVEFCPEGVDEAEVLEFCRQLCADWKSFKH